MGQIIDLLLAAGYFRVRIKGLSSFDKVMLTYLSITGINRGYLFLLIFVLFNSFKEIVLKLY